MNSKRSSKKRSSSKKKSLPIKCEGVNLENIPEKKLKELNKKLQEIKKLRDTIIKNENLDDDVNKFIMKTLFPFRVYMNRYDAKTNKTMSVKTPFFYWKDLNQCIS